MGGNIAQHEDVMEESVSYVDVYFLLEALRLYIKRHDFIMERLIEE